MNPFADDEEIFEKMKENNPVIESFAKKMGLIIIDPVNL